MKRNMDLVREIMLQIEGHDEPGGPRELTVEGCSAAQVQYHLGLLWQAGLITAIDASSMSAAQFIPTGITWAGHEFIEHVRSDTAWKRAKDTVLAKGGALTLDIMKEVAAALARGQMGM